MWRKKFQKKFHELASLVELAANKLFKVGARFKFNKCFSLTDQSFSTARVALAMWKFMLSSVDKRIWDVAENQSNTEQ